jgi:hypothetical protein
MVNSLRRHTFSVSSNPTYSTVSATHLTTKRSTRASEPRFLLAAFGCTLAGMLFPGMGAACPFAGDTNSDERADADTAAVATLRQCPSSSSCPAVLCVFWEEHDVKCRPVAECELCQRGGDANAPAAAVEDGGVEQEVEQVHDTYDEEQREHHVAEEEEDGGEEEENDEEEPSPVVVFSGCLILVLGAEREREREREVQSEKSEEKAHSNSRREKRKGCGKNGEGKQHRWALVSVGARCV